jgi:nitrilase
VAVVRVAIAQAEVTSDLATGLVRTGELAREAAGRGATLVAFPESWLPGYPAWLDVCRDVALWDHAPVKAEFARFASENVDVGGASGHALSAIARETGIALAIGVSERVNAGAGRGTLYNAFLLYDSHGALVTHHRKLVPTYTERMIWGAGDADGIHGAGAGGARVGALICWEHWMPLARQALHESGEDIHLALWPTVHERHQLASRHYALEGRCFVLAAGSLMRASALPPEFETHPDKVSSPDQWVLRGGSAIVGPDGEYVMEPVFDAPAMLVADLDLARVREESMALDVGGHYHRPDCLALRVLRTGRRRLD